jgi:hypothetical protein
LFAKFACFVPFAPKLCLKTWSLSSFLEKVIERKARFFFPLNIKEAVAAILKVKPAKRKMLENILNSSGGQSLGCRLFY